MFMIGLNRKKVKQNKNEYKENSWDFLIIPLYYVFR